MQRTCQRIGETAGNTVAAEQNRSLHIAMWQTNLLVVDANVSAAFLCHGSVYHNAPVTHSFFSEKLTIFLQGVLY